MSDQKIDLALAFLQSQPASAAAVLEQQPVEHVAAFLRDVPHDRAAAVLKRMLPKNIASVCRQLEPAVSASFLTEMDTHLIAAIMRFSDDDLARAILELLPERTKIACRLILHYSEEAVGAWMLANIVTLPNDCSAKEACTRLSSEHDIIETEAVHIVGREGKLQGEIGVTRLLRAAPDTPITSIMKDDPETISGRAALISVVDHSVWAHRDTVAVINRNQRIVGILRHADLRRGLDAISNTIARPSGSDPLTGILEVYGNALLALFGAVCEAAGTRTRRGEQR